MNEKSKPTGRVLLVGVSFTAFLLLVMGWWLSQEGCRLVLRGHRGPVRALALNRDATLLASGGVDQTVCLWELPAGRLRFRFRIQKSEVSAVALSPDSEYLAAGGEDGSLTLRKISTGEEVLNQRAHSKGTFALVFSADGKNLYSAGADRVIRRWDVSNGKEQALLRGHSGAIRALAISADGKILASAGSGDNAIRLWRPPGLTPVKLLRGHTRGILRLAIVADHLYSGDRQGIMKAWDLFSGRERASLQADEDRISGLGATEDRVVTGCEKREITVYPRTNLTPGAGVGWKQRSGVANLLVAGEMVITAGLDGRLRVWDLPRR